MKKLLLVVFTACMPLLSFAANETYLQKMEETLEKLHQCNSVEDFQQVANTFKTIASVEKKEWLPLYYEAQCYIQMSFADRTGAGTKDAYLDQAWHSLEKVRKLVPDEAELYALQAFYHTGRLVINPAERAMNTAPLISQSIGKALQLDPGNPRALLIQLTNEMGTAQFFGQDTSPMCKQAQTLLETWDSHTPDSPIHPSWGKGQVEDIVKNCGE